MSESSESARWARGSNVGRSGDTGKPRDKIFADTTVYKQALYHFVVKPLNNYRSDTLLARGESRESCQGQGSRPALLAEADARLLKFDGNILYFLAGIKA